MSVKRDLPLECHIRPWAIVYLLDDCDRVDVTGVNEHDFLVKRFEEHRPHLRAVAYRMLGSLSDADDAVQETWLRVSRADTGDVVDLRAWLTTIAARICLDTLKSRKSRPEEPLGPHLPEPIVSPEDGVDPEHEALLADSVGLALLVVLDSLSPAERLAFVLHDMFGVPFDEIAPILDRSPAATRQLASRARRWVQGENAIPDADPSRQRRLVNAFLAASRKGDFEALIALLDPDVVLRIDTGALVPGQSRLLRGASAVAEQTITFMGSGGGEPRPALVNGAAGVVFTSHGRPGSVVGFTVAGGKIVAIDVLADRDRLRQLDLHLFGEDPAAPRTDTRGAGDGVATEPKFTNEEDQQR
jgi:RNA polymerase sigma factor (sigma-70 family)